MVARYRLNVDYTSATAGTDDGHVVFTPNVNVTGGSGLGTNATIISPLGTQAIADSVAISPATGTSFTVTGNVASGAAETGNPVLIGVFDGTNRRSLSGDTNGNGYETLRWGTTVSVALRDDQDGMAASNTANKLAVASRNTVFNGTNWDRERKPSVTYRLLASLATTNGASIKASAGDLHKIVGNNTVASKRYLKLYNKASAPTVGTDTPVLTICLPASGAFDLDFSAYYFGTGIAIAITGAAADADTTAIGAGDIECLNVTYA